MYRVLLSGSCRCFLGRGHQNKVCEQNDALEELERRITAEKRLGAGDELPRFFFRCQLSCRLEICDPRYSK